MNVPAWLNVWLYMSPTLEVAPLAQFRSLGEQNLLSAVQLLPLVTL